MRTRIRKHPPRNFTFDADETITERYYPNTASDRSAFLAIVNDQTSTPAAKSAAMAELDKFGPETITGKIRAVRMRYPAGQTSTLETVRLRIVKEAGQSNPSSDDYLIYDSGLLDNGEIPDGGTVAIDLTGSDTVAFWLDDMGDDGPCFDGQFRCEMAINGTTFDAGDNVVLSLDCEEYQ